MCGLNGEINFDGKPADAGALQRMCDSLALRLSLIHISEPRDA